MLLIFTDFVIKSLFTNYFNTAVVKLIYKLFYHFHKLFLAFFLASLIFFKICIYCLQSFPQIGFFNFFFLDFFLSFQGLIFFGHLLSFPFSFFNPFFYQFLFFIVKIISFYWFLLVLKRLALLSLIILGIFSSLLNFLLSLLVLNTS